MLQPQSKIRDLFKVPPEIRPMDFTVVLADGVTRPEDTVGTYRVTPGLARAFAQSLDLVGAALRDGRSQASYLHGSFGTGKSHFMALLSLLLAGNPRRLGDPRARRSAPRTSMGLPRPAAAATPAHARPGPSFEGAIFGGYLAHLREAPPRRPDAPAVRRRRPVRRRRMLSANASATKRSSPRSHRTSKRGGGASWPSSVWDRDRFDAARTSASPQERSELITALVRTPFFRSFAGDQQRRYVDFDAGLQELTRHAETARLRRRRACSSTS
jgi:hypothetical protein